MSSGQLARELRAHPPSGERPPAFALVGSGELKRSHRAFLLLSSIVPALGVLAAIALSWRRAVGVSDLLLLALFYALCGFGISMGYHRLFSHRSFRARRPLKVALALFGTFAGHGPVIAWVAHHRKHHTFSDREGDPHSPYAFGSGSRLRALRGLWFAHIAWRFSENVKVDTFRYAPDLLRDRDLRFISRHFIAITIAGLLAPGAIALAIGGGLTGALYAILWAGVVRMFLGHHVTYSVNSLGHFIGPRRYATEDHSRNIWWLAIPTFGDSWHNNHHAFPTSAAHGLRRRELDISALAIGLCARLGLASDVVAIDERRLREKELRR
ncbi:MAG TPA: fatty acid desaturase [Solirubrobacteraceae bacterium]|nr:fatty acid desaturase [Solirubrobacteraceae bacterium]